MIPADPEFLAIANARVLGQPQSRRRVRDVVGIELGIAQRRVVLPLDIGDRTVVAADGDRCAAAIENVDRPDLFQGPIVQPKLAAFAAPDARIDIDGTEFQAVEDQGQFAPMARGGEFKAARRDGTVAGQNMI